MGVIYKIENVINGKVYIGSTDRDFRFRKAEHYHQLRRSKHHSIYLQNAWNKYGEENFIFAIVQFTENPDHTHQMELYWVDHYVTTKGLDFIYNTKPKEKSHYGKPSAYIYTAAIREKMSIAAKRRLQDPENKKKLMEAAEKGRNARKRKPKPEKNIKNYVFISPSGVTYTTNNITQFSKEHLLNPQCMIKLSAGKLKTYKGWKEANPFGKGKKQFGPFISPVGIIYEVVGMLKDFCITHDLHLSTMVAVNKGKIKNHRGWSKI